MGTRTACGEHSAFLNAPWVCSALDARPGASLTEEQRQGLTALYEELAVSYPKSSAVRRAPLDFKVGARMAARSSGGGEGGGGGSPGLAGSGRAMGGTGELRYGHNLTADRVAGEPGSPQEGGAAKRCSSRNTSFHRRRTEQHSMKSILVRLRSRWSEMPMGSGPSQTARARALTAESPCA